MGDAAALALLANADGTAALPRLGGMARPNGVVIVSERFWAFAAPDGSIREGEMPARLLQLRRVPLLRGLVRLVASLSPLFRNTGAARRRERLILALGLLAPFALVFLPEAVGIAAGVAISLALVAVLLRGPALSLHGAEHRAITAAEERCLVAAWSGEARPSRFARRCGTNFAAIALPLTFGVEAVWPVPLAFYTPVAVVLVSLALAMELWQIVQRSTGWFARVVLAPGLALQRLTTREPSLAETRVALRAAASVLRRELATSST